MPASSRSGRSPRSRSRPPGGGAAPRATPPAPPPARGARGALGEALAPLAPGGVRVAGRESEAAVLGASTTPGAGRTPFVLDLGGGTVDLHREVGAGDEVVSAAGAGEVVTRICGGLLSRDVGLAA